MRSDHVGMGKTKGDVATVEGPTISESGPRPTTYGMRNSARRWGGSRLGGAHERQAGRGNQVYAMGL